MLYVLSNLNCNSRHICADSSSESWRCTVERGLPANCFPDYSGKPDRRPVGNQKPCESASAWLSRNAIREFRIVRIGLLSSGYTTVPVAYYFQSPSNCHQNIFFCFANYIESAEYSERTLENLSGYSICNCKLY